MDEVDPPPVVEVPEGTEVSLLCELVSVGVTSGCVVESEGPSVDEFVGAASVVDDAVCATTNASCEKPQANGRSN